MLVLIWCPACDAYTQHKRRHKYTEEEGEGAHYCTCTRCHRTRRVGEDELTDLLYQASRAYPHPYNYQEGIWQTHSDFR